MLVTAKNKKTKDTKRVPEAWLNHPRIGKNWERVTKDDAPNTAKATAPATTKKEGNKNA